MAKKNKPWPGTYEDAIQLLMQDRAQLEHLYSDMRHELALKIHENFVNMGGCSQCRGRGWVVTWDTLDSVDGSCAEYGPCPNESCSVDPTTRASTRTTIGLDVDPNDRINFGHNKYDRIRGVLNPIYDPKYAIFFESIHSQLHRIVDSIDQLKFLSRVEVGKVVVVVKGRKVPIGFSGSVFWMGDTPYGIRIGIKAWDSKGTEISHWTYEKNVQVLIEE